MLLKDKIKDLYDKAAGGKQLPQMLPLDERDAQLRKGYDETVKEVDEYNTNLPSAIGPSGYRRPQGRSVEPFDQIRNRTLRSDIDLIKSWQERDYQDKTKQKNLESIDAQIAKLQEEIESSRTNRGILGDLHKGGKARIGKDGKITMEAPDLSESQKLEKSLTESQIKENQKTLEKIKSGDPDTIAQLIMDSANDPAFKGFQDMREKNPEQYNKYVIDTAMNKLTIGNNELKSNYAKSYDSPGMTPSSFARQQAEGSGGLMNGRGPSLSYDKFGNPTIIGKDDMSDTPREQNVTPVSQPPVSPQPENTQNVNGSNQIADIAVKRIIQRKESGQEIPQYVLNDFEKEFPELYPDLLKQLGISQEATQETNQETTPSTAVQNLTRQLDSRGSFQPAYTGEMKPVTDKTIADILRESLAVPEGVRDYATGDKQNPIQRSIANLKNLKSIEGKTIKQLEVMRDNLKYNRGRYTSAEDDKRIKEINAKIAELKNK